MPVISEAAIEFIGIEFQRRLPVIFGPALVFGFIFGSVAKGYAQEGHDLDVFVCLQERRPQGERLMLSWLEDLHRRYGLNVDHDYPAEIVTESQIKEVVSSASSIDLRLGLNDNATFDKVVWIQALADRKMAAVGDLRCLADLESFCSAWPSVWAEKYSAKVHVADPITVLRKAVQFQQRRPSSSFELTGEGPQCEIPTKADRLKEFYRQLGVLPKTVNGLQAYQQICTVINSIEDEIFGLDEWHLPRSFNSGAASARLYPPQPDNFEPVPGYRGVTNMVLKREFIFVSQFGAIEIQRDDGSSERDSPYSRRRGCVVFAKADLADRSVWDDANR